MRILFRPITVLALDAIRVTRYLDAESARSLLGQFVSLP